MVETLRPRSRDRIVNYIDSMQRPFLINHFFSKDLPKQVSNNNIKQYENQDGGAMGSRMLIWLPTSEIIKLIYAVLYL